MKQKDMKPCAACGKGVMHTRSPIFFRVTVERMVINLPAVQRQHGLEMMLGGCAPLAAVMGPDEDMAASIGEAVPAVLCLNCALEFGVLELAERLDAIKAIEAKPA